MSRRVVNRILLALVGLVLLAGGALLLAGGLYLNHRHHAVLAPADRVRWRGEDWWWPTVFAGLAVVALLSLSWMVAQLRTGTADRITVPDLADLPVRLRGAALARAVTDEAEQIPGVSRARVRILGGPRARIALTLAPGAAPGPVLHELAAGPLAHARRSVGTALSAEARVRVESGSVPRVQ
ncbi:hypothetical protein EDD99_2001 [Streptomyces sp. 846.5]|nr:alkaline shock response membrane anchor protein AmaP [Streptomyces sp. 846.5]TDU03562.1 hypothetical protein EDD99_2001 [Streptomyces sp. 846.5]